MLPKRKQRLMTVKYTLIIGMLLNTGCIGILFARHFIQIIKMETEYETYGDQWIAEMKKWSKDLLIDKIRDILIERSELKEKLDDLKDRYNDLLSSNGF